MSERFQKPFIDFPSILGPTPGDPQGYVTNDGMWAAVPFGKKFMILHNGEQVHVVGTLATAKSYINKQLKVSKPKKVKSSTSSLEAFL
jgi:hypothetical protein